MQLTFLGTKAFIEESSPRHARHSALEIGYRNQRVMIDCGLDWLEEIHNLRPQAIVLTHTHPDHALGLQNGVPCPVHATAQSWELLEGFPIAERRTIRPREPVEICGIVFEAFPVQHSIRAPAVGYRISAGSSRLLYAPDLARIEERREALAGVDLYVGDGSCFRHSLLRQEGDVPCGHVPIPTQLAWCAEEGIPEAIFTHCGSEIVTGKEDAHAEEIGMVGRKLGVEVRIAYDGMEVVLA